MFFLCTFCHIENVGNPYLLASWASSITSFAVISFGAKVTTSIQAEFDIPSSSVGGVLGEISTILNWPIYGDISLLYKSVAILSAAQVVSGGLSINTYFPR